MCKYCEENTAIWFKKRSIYDEGTEYFENEPKRLACIYDVRNKSFFKNRTYLEVATNAEQEDCYHIRINYHSFCGKNLKHKTISNIIKAIIDYKYEKKYCTELDVGVAKCSECGKNIKDEASGETHSASIEGKKIFCSKCSKKRFGV